MPPTLRSALAPSFAWTSSAPDIVLTFASGTSPVNVTVASGTYRMLLAGSSADFIRVVQSAINTALSGAGRAETMTLVMGSDSRITITSTGAFSASISDALSYLGFSTAISDATTSTATYPPRFFATFVSRTSRGWSPRMSVAGAVTAEGVGYGVQMGTWRDEDEVTFDWIPYTTAQRTSLGVYQTPLYPDPTYSRSQYGAHAGQWSIVDTLHVSLGKTCGFAAGNLQDHLTSTSERFDLVTLAPEAIGEPVTERIVESWDAYFRWAPRIIRQTTATSTRA